MKLFRRRAETLDRQTLERVVEGDRALPAEARPLARVLRAAAAPAHPEELRGEYAARAAFRTAGTEPAARRKRSTGSTLTRLLSLKVLAVILGATATAGGVALAANNGILPDVLDPGERVTSTPSKPGNRGSKAPAGPASHRGSAGVDAVPATVDALCTAYLAKDRAERDKALKTAEYQPLVQAAGGANKVANYCEKLLRDQASRAPGRQDGQQNSAAPGNPPNPDSSKRSHMPPDRRTASPGR